MGIKNVLYKQCTIVVDNHGLFIYLDLGYPRFFHDINIFRESNLYKNWRWFFVHTYEYFKYPLGDPCYMGEEMFMM